MKNHGQFGRRLAWAKEKEKDKKKNEKKEDSSPVTSKKIGRFSQVKGLSSVFLHSPENVQKDCDCPVGVRVGNSDGAFRPSS